MFPPSRDSNHGPPAPQSDALPPDHGAPQYGMKSVLKARYTLRVFSGFRIIFTTKVSTYLGYKMMRKLENPFFATKVSTLK